MLSEGSRLRLQSWLARFHRWQEERKSRNGVQAESGHPSTAWRITVVSWMVVLIATPICIWVFGEQIFPSMAILGVVTQLAAVLSALVQAWPARRVLSALALVAGFTWTVELIGSATGFLFGNYDYTQALQPQLLGVPLVIPLAWAMMLFPSWAVSQIILERKAARLGRYYPLVFAALTGLVFTAWDLYLDPQMVGRGLWVWETPGGYFGIPWANFIGWWLASALITLIIRPGKVPYTPLLLVYTITWIFQAMGLGVFWGQFGPAMTGFLGMGIFCIYAWQNLEVPVSVIIDWLPIRPRSKDRNSPALNSPIAASHPAASKNE